MSSAVRPSAARMSAVRPSAARAGDGYFDNPYALTAGVAAAGLGAYGGIRGATALYKRYLGGEPLSGMPSVGRVSAKKEQTGRPNGNIEVLPMPATHPALFAAAANRARSGGGGGPETPFAVGGGSNRKEVLTVGNNSIRLPPSNANARNNASTSAKPATAGHSIVAVQAELIRGESPNEKVWEQKAAEATNPASAQAASTMAEGAATATAIQQNPSNSGAAIEAATHLGNASADLNLLDSAGDNAATEDFQPIVDEVKEGLQTGADVGAQAENLAAATGELAKKAMAWGDAELQIARETAQGLKVHPQIVGEKKALLTATLHPKAGFLMAGGKPTVLYVMKKDDSDRPTYGTTTQPYALPPTSFGRYGLNTNNPGLINGLVPVGVNGTGVYKFAYNNKKLSQQYIPPDQLRYEPAPENYNDTVRRPVPQSSARR